MYYNNKYGYEKRRAMNTLDGLSRGHGEQRNNHNCTVQCTMIRGSITSVLGIRNSPGHEFYAYPFNQTLHRKAVPNITPHTESSAGIE